jgi:hypothetical protein
MVVDIVATGLYYEDILVPDRFRNFHAGLAIGELFDSDRYEGNIQPDIVRSEGRLFRL